MTVKQEDYPGRPNHTSPLNLSLGIKDRDIRLKAWERCYMLLLAWRWRGSHGKECQIHLNWEQPPTNILQLEKNWILPITKMNLKVNLPPELTSADTLFQISENPGTPCQASNLQDCGLISGYCLRLLSL